MVIICLQQVHGTYEQERNGCPQSENFVLITRQGGARSSFFTMSTVPAGFEAYYRLYAVNWTPSKYGDN